MSSYLSGWNRLNFGVDNSKEFQRDYDKNPVILDNYEYEILWGSIFFVAIFAIFIMDLVRYFTTKESAHIFAKHLENSFTETKLYSGILYLFISLIAILIIFLKRDKNNKIYLKKDKIVFVNLNKKYEIQREIDVDKDYDFIKSFFNINRGVVFRIVIIMPILLLSIYIYMNEIVFLQACQIIFPVILSNITFYTIMFRLINSNFKYFSLFPIIWIADPIYPYRKSPPRHFYIFIYNYKVKQEVKEYFYNNYKIDIDKIKKSL